MAEALSYLLVIFREPMLLVMTAIGTCAGVYVGAIPGLSGTMAVSLLVSFTIRLGDAYGAGDYDRRIRRCSIRRARDPQFC